MKKITSNEQSILILLSAFIFGAWFRIMPAWMAGFPVNDGGMFYAMILDLQANHYATPMFTTYNHLSIPFAYPPLGFYVGAFLSDLFKVSPLSVIRWLPGIINALTVPAFYFFAKEVLKDKFQSSLAVLVFAFIPHLTSWHSMGGGLTRSFGMLFMLLTLGFVQRVFGEKAFQHEEHEGLKGKKAEQASAHTSFVNFVPFVLNKNVLGAIMFGGLTTLSHTEAPIFTIAIAVYIWAIKSRSLKGLLNGALIALGVLLVGGGWYALVIFRHGFEPFQSISQTGAHSFLAVFKILNINFLTEEPYLGLLGVLGILGISALVLKKEYFIPLMLVVIFLAQPRSAHVIGNIPLAMAAGYFAAEILLPALRNIQSRQAAFFIIAGIYVFSNSMLYGINLSQKVLAEDERNAMQWIKENTPQESAFVVISGDQNAFCDPITEWFPALTERANITTIQGTEWLFNDAFSKNMIQSHRAQACVDEGLECFTRESNALGKSFDYVYISISPATKNCSLSEDSALTTRALILALEDSSAYDEIFRSDDVVIFQK